MNLSTKFAGHVLNSAVCAMALAGCVANREAGAQAPYLLPYTMQTLAGGAAVTPGTAGTTPFAAPLTGTFAGYTPCSGAPSFFIYDPAGDGCPITSGSINIGDGLGVGTDKAYDVRVDQQGNVYFIDSSSSPYTIRRIDARSGLVSVYFGSYTTSFSATYSAYSAYKGLCATTVDKYGDGCTNTDGKANATGGYTANMGQSLGMNLAKNGDLYLADLGSGLVHKVSAATGLVSIIAGSVATGGATPWTNAGTSGTDNSLSGISAIGAPIKPRGVAVDYAGNIYIGDANGATNDAVREVTPGTYVVGTTTGPGTMTTIAGTVNTNGTTGVTDGYAGDGGPATSALFNLPSDVELDASGNVFIGDYSNSRVRVIYRGDSAGTSVAKLIALTNPSTVTGPSAVVVGDVYTVMGGGSSVYTPGSVVPAESIAIGSMRELVLDTHGNIYEADNSHNVIWFLDATTGYVRAIAGSYNTTVAAAGAGCATQTDSLGDNCPATTATVSGSSGQNAMGVAVDNLENLYITDSQNLRVRKVTTDQDFPATATGTTVTQTLDVHFAVNDGPAASSPYVLSGNADFKVGTTACTMNADNTQDCLVPVSFTPSVAGLDTANLTITSNVNGSTVVGVSGIGNAATVAFDPGLVSLLGTAFKDPNGIAQDGAGNIYVADTGNNRVVRYTPSGTMTLVAGNGTQGFAGDGGSALAPATELSGPTAVAVSPGGVIYIADTGNNVIRSISPVNGIITTVAGGASALCEFTNDTVGDGCPGTATTFAKPSGLVSDPDGNIYIADTGNSLIRELTVGGYVSLVGGGANAICTVAGADSLGNGCNPKAAIFNKPTGLAIDVSRNIYIADTGDNEIRELTRGIVVLLAGDSGISGSGGNGGPATSAELAGPTGVAVDAGGDLYIADAGNSAIRFVNATGTINTVMGTLATNGSGAVPGPASLVELNNPTGIVSNGAGNLVVLDSGNNRTLVDNRSSLVYNFGRTNQGFPSPVLMITETNTGSSPITALGAPLFTVSGVVPSGGSQFTVAGSGSNGCGSTTSLAAGASCYISAQFSPTTISPPNAAATYAQLSTSPAILPNPSIQLSGTGAVLTSTASLVALTPPATPPQYAIGFSVSATITASSCNTAAPACYPTGAVSFLVDGTSVGSSTLASGTSPTSTSATATFVISSPLSVGSHTITVVYGGDFYYASDTSPLFSVTINKENTTGIANASPNPVPQFNAITLSANVAATSGNPTGTFTFYAGSVPLGTASINGTTGQAVLLDTLVTASTSSYYNNFGLAAGTYAITAVYSGDGNYSGSTSAAATLVITPLAQSFTTTTGLTPPATVTTFQGSTGQLYLTVTPTNTLSGTVSFSCTGMPAYSVCGFTPSTLTFIPVALAPATQFTQVTLWTNVASTYIPSGETAYTRPTLSGHRNRGGTALAALLGWPIMMISLAGSLGVRKHVSKASLFRLVALSGVLVGGSIALGGCASSIIPTAGTTPTGTYTVKVIATASNGVTAAQTVTFIVTPAIGGE